MHGTDHIVNGRAQRHRGGASGWRGLIALGCCLAAMPAAAQLGGSRATLRIDRLDLHKPPELQLYATDLDSTGAPLLDRKRESYRLLVDGVPLGSPSKLRRLRDVGDPIALTLVIQVSTALKDALTEIVDGCKRLIDALPSGSRVGLVAYTDVTVQETKPASVAEVKRALDDLRIHDEAIEVDLPTALRDALDGLDNPRLPDNRMIVVLSDGLTSNLELRVFSELGSRAREKGVAVHTIGYAPLEPARLHTLAELSRRGGGTFRDTTNPGAVTQALAALRDQIENQLVLTYALPKAFDGKLHDFQLELPEGQGSNITSAELALFEPKQQESAVPGWVVFLLVGVLVIGLTVGGMFLWRWLQRRGTTRERVEAVSFTSDDEDDEDEDDAWEEHTPREATPGSRRTAGRRRNTERHAVDEREDHDGEQIEDEGEHQSRPGLGLGVVSSDIDRLFGAPAAPALAPMDPAVPSGGYPSLEPPDGAATAQPGGSWTPPGAGVGAGAGAWSAPVAPMASPSQDASPYVPPTGKQEPSGLWPPAPGVGPGPMSSNAGGGFPAPAAGPFDVQDEAVSPPGSRIGPLPAANGDPWQGGHPTPLAAAQPVEPPMGPMGGLRLPDPDAYLRQAGAAPLAPTTDLHDSESQPSGVEAPNPVHAVGPAPLIAGSGIPLDRIPLLPLHHPAGETGAQPGRMEDRKTAVMAVEQLADADFAAWIVPLRARGYDTIVVQDGFTIGSDSGCHLPLNDDNVAPRHGQLRLDSRGYRLELRGNDGGTLAQPLNDGDVFEIGRHRFLFKIASRFSERRGAASAPAGVPGLDGLDQGRSLALRDGVTYVLGSHPSCALVARGEGVGSRHAVALRKDRSCIIADLGAAGGVHYQGRAIGQRELTPGDEVTIGAVRLLYAVED